MELRKLVYAIVLISVVIAALGIIPLFLHLIGTGFVHGSDGQNRYSIYFETNPVKTVSEGNSLFSRIDLFFIDHPEYNVPSDVKLYVDKCQGCDPMNKLIRFKDEPIEIYQVEFSSRGTNYIHEIYSFEKGRFVSVEMKSLNDIDRIRVLSRLKLEVLDKIDWIINY